MGPIGCTTQPAIQIAFGPRTMAAGRRARSTSATVVSATSIAPAMTIALRWPGVNSLHAFSSPRHGST